MVRIIGTNDDRNSRLYATAIMEACMKRCIDVEYRKVNSEQEFLSECDTDHPTLVLEPCDYEIPAIKRNLEQHNTAKAILCRCEEITRYMDYKPSVLIINRSELIGRPLVKMLLDNDFTVSVAHSKTNCEILQNLINAVDIVVLATGHDFIFDLYCKHVIDVSNDYKGDKGDCLTYVNMRYIGASTINIMLDEVYLGFMREVE